MNKRNKVDPVLVYQTMLVLSFAFMLLFIFFKLIYFFYFGVFLLGLSIISFSLSEKITRLWLSFSEKISRVNSFIILFVVFHVFLIPVSFLYRWIKKDPLCLKKPENKNSMFVEANKTYTERNFENYW